MNTAYTLENMARLEDLIAQVSDARLRKELAEAAADMKRHQRFGLVFEEHIPETTALFGLPIQPGAIVQFRREPQDRATYRVVAVDGERASVEPVEGGEARTLSTTDLLTVKRFGDPIFPTLTPVGAVRRAEPGHPHHAVINGENYHALQLLLYLYEGQVDCIYIDPPYNTGARDWKYNNRYVDTNDIWHHSKWLSMMEKRLRLAKRLLRPDGVLICTVDDNEVHHLGMLLERVFPGYLRYPVVTVINPKGREKANFAPVHEYAFFLVPDIGSDVILPMPLGDARVRQMSMSFEDQDEDSEPDEAKESGKEDAEGEAADDFEDQWEYRHARRRGGGAESSSYREKRPNQFYPIYIDEQARKVVRVGESIPLGQEPDFQKVDGLRPLWPIDADGRHRVWSFIPTSMQRLIDEGHVLVGKYHAKRDDWTVNYRVPKKQYRKLKSVWVAKTYDAGTHGTEVLKRYLGKPGLFPFPKSIYVVKDCLDAVVRNRPNALIVDFFAGSGTTLHAACLLNASDGGRRRCILVTNNEVGEEIARELNRNGYTGGDPEFERHGIFEQVTRPRCEAVVTGKRPDGTPVQGKHVTGRPHAEGFPENVEFFQLDYLDPDEVDLDLQFDAILPTLWLAAGGIGNREPRTGDKPFSIPTGSTYGVLFQDSAFRAFRAALANHPAVTHVWLVTDSEEAYTEMRAALPPDVTASMLYRDYLRHFRVNTDQAR